jgi:hypothetical protein
VAFNNEQPPPTTDTMNALKAINNTGSDQATKGA